MKNVLIVDGANNCAYDIFAFTDKEFALVFPAKGQDIEFVEDVVKRLGEKGIAKLWSTVWKRRIKKKNANGIHGTLFFQLEFKKKYYPTKRDEEMVNVFTGKIMPRTYYG